MHRFTSTAESSARVGAGLALLILLPLFSAPSSGLAAAAWPTGRNVLFIVVDDWRDWAGYNDHYAGTIHTPHIDTLARVSTRFTRAYTTVPNCLASRTSVLMGLSPATHGVGLITAMKPGVGSPQYNAVYENPDVLSLPEVMGRHGYLTAAAGKVFHRQLPERWHRVGPPIARTQVRGMADPGPDGTFMNPEVLPPGMTHPDHTIAEWAADFLSNYDDDKPFFLAIGFYQPHLPWRVPQWAYDLYPLEDVAVHMPAPDELEDEPAEALALASRPVFMGTSQDELIRKAGKAREYTRAYLASLSHTDAMIGQVLAALRASERAERTDIVLWSDHGYHLGEKFHWRKSTLWEPSVRVPLLISSPGNDNYAVRDEDTPVSLLDLAPTVLDLAGLPPFAQFEGKPLQQALRGDAVDIFMGRARARIINGLKVIDYDVSSPPGEHDTAAYLLGVDPGEEMNLIAPLAAALRLPRGTKPE
ncbi:MAG: sulfatase-like hydrolase/transferase [Pseudomonadota bacterium]